MQGRPLWVTAETRETTEHPDHVAVQDRRRASERDARDGASGVAADAGEVEQLLDCLRDASFVPRQNFSRPALEVAGPGVVAQAGPEPQHLVLRRRGQRGHRWEPLHEPLVIGEDRGDLSLLEHDLRNPDRVRVARLPPGQIPVAGAIPRQQVRCDLPGASGFRVGLG